MVVQRRVNGNYSPSEKERIRQSLEGSSEVVKQLGNRSSKAFLSQAVSLEGSFCKTLSRI